MARSDPTSKTEASSITRAALLEAGAALLREQPVGAILTQVKAPEVARRAGRTTGAFFHHWPDQESYQRELVHYVLSPDRQMFAVEARQAVQHLLDSGIPLEEILRVTSRANFEQVRTNPYFPLLMALWSKQGQDTRLRDLLRSHYRQVTAEVTPLYRIVLEANGLEPRPPYTFELIAATITALVEGMSVRATVEPEAIPLSLPPAQGAAKVPLKPGLDDGPWDLFSLSVLALLPSMTAPVVKRDQDVWLDHEDVRGVVRRLRETWEVFVGRNLDVEAQPSLLVRAQSECSNP